MYKVLPDGSGWSVFWIECPDTEPRQRQNGRFVRSTVLYPDAARIPKAVPRPEDEAHKWEPYPQRSAANRRCKKLNDALEKVDAMIARDGAIIL